MEGDEKCGAYTFAQAFEIKYADHDPELYENIEVSAKRRAAFLSQMIHKKREVLALDGCRIGQAGNKGEIAELCPRLKELDLANNSFNCWEQVFFVITQLPRLSFLNLSGNLMNCGFEEEKIHEIIRSKTKPPLQKLVLNNTKVQFGCILKLLSIFPEIDELHLSLNQFGKVDEFPDKYPQIKRIHFNRNDIHCWEDVKNIGKLFPCLKCLILGENPLKEIRIEEDEVVFPELKTLSLSDTEIQDWQSIDEIRKFPALEDLRLVGIPVACDETSDKRRQLLISRLPNIKKLNGSSISADEREDAERAFIRYYMDCDDPPKRYHELVAMHGQLDRLAEVDLGKTEYANLKLFIEEDEFSKIRVDLSIDTKSLKREVGRKVGLKPMEFRMFYCDYEMIGAYGLEELRYANKLLYTYRMKDDDQIHIRRQPKKN